ncbi:helix-turn-helix transcriptional regulator [Modestobacter sp. DSM 44400]|uniref:helix-turn-helix transcriptional regulator n=1 Tax=Modestobacter sp. DSM 44400 TaxID=1550230 RepID=UPI000B884E24
MPTARSNSRASAPACASCGRRPGLTQADLAERAGVDRIAISHIERGQRDVGVVRAAAIAQAQGRPDEGRAAAAP